MRPSELLDSRFEIEREAGAGAMGVVLRARDVSTGVRVAVKVLKGDQRARARFDREARVLSELHHPAIVRYVAHGTTPSGAAYLAMEWLEGEDLATRLTKGPLGLQETLELGRRIADALAVAHARGIVHRDLKPSNLFLPGSSVAGIKLIDFGIARVQHATGEVTAAGTVLGTPGYMAPEQARGDKAIDARADVFALGCVLFECLTGRPAFIGENIIALLAKIVMEEAPRVSELRAGVPAPVDDLVARMLAKSPMERPADGSVLREDFESLEAIANEVDDVTVPTRRSAITRGEQQLVSVVIAAERRAEDARPSTVDIQEDDAGAEIASDAAVAAARTEIAESDVGTAFDALARLGARIERLADGAIIATLHGVGAAATDQAAQAARCALSLRGALPETAIVLATGRAVFSGRLPIGDVIERAAKLLRLAPRRAENGALPIHLDDLSAGLLPSRFRVQKGALGPELVSEESGADAPRTVLGRPTRFVGRNAEMGTLTGLYAEVESDAVSRAVVVTGAPGFGKSRLRREFIEVLRQRESRPEIWGAVAEPMGAGAPLGMLRRVLRDAMEMSDGSFGDRSRILTRVSRGVPPENALRVATFLAELIGTPLDAEPALTHAEAQLAAARREPPLMAEQMQRAVVEFLRAECATRPVVLAFEDAHWGDQPTMKLVDACLRELADSPLLVIAFARPEIDVAFPRLWAERGGLRMSLTPLTRRAAERLATDVLGTAPNSDLLLRLVGQAAGNPFFLEELLREIVAGSPGTMPDTIVAMVQKRIEALDEHARRLLRAASVFGGVFWRGSIAALLAGATDIDVDRRLADLVDREIVFRHSEARIDGEFEFEFRHALLRDAAYQMLTDADRALAHRFAGEWLEGVGEQNRALLAEHFELGGEKARAAHNYTLAATQALHADDLDACLRLSKRGLDAADAAGDMRGALHLARAEAYHWRAEFEDAYAESVEAMHLLEPGSDGWFNACAVAVAGCATRGRTDEATSLAAVLAERGMRERPAFLMAAAQCVAFLPPSATADALLLLLPDTSAEIGDALLAARIEVARGIRAEAKGDRVDVLEHFSRATEHFEQAGHLRGARAARANAGYASAELGRHEEAERTLRAVLDDAQRAGVKATVGWTTMHLGMVLGRLGRTSEALELEREALELARQQDNRPLEAEVAVATADIFNASGAPDLAIEHAERALSVAEAPALRAAALAALSTARLALGDVEG